MRSRSGSGVLLGCLLAAGCAHAPQAESKWTALAASEQPVAPGQVQVVADAPDNITAADGKVVSDSRYPTPADPDRVLGVIEVDDAPDANAIRTAAVEEAAGRGANLLIAAGPSRFVAVRRSPASPNLPSASDALAELLRQHGGLAPSAPAAPIELSRAGDVQVQLKRGGCYWFAVALDRDATCHGTSGKRQDCLGWSFPLELQGTLLRPTREAQVLAQPAPERPLWTRSFLVPLGCSTRDGASVPVHLISSAGARGTALVQLVTGDISEQAIARWQGRYQQLEAQRAAEEAERMRRMEMVCTVCGRLAQECNPDDPNAYDACEALERCVHAHLPPDLTGSSYDCLPKRSAPGSP